MHNELQQWLKSPLGRECIDQARGECQAEIAKRHQERLRRVMALSPDKSLIGVLRHELVGRN